MCDKCAAVLIRDYAAFTATADAAARKVRRMTGSAVTADAASADGLTTMWSRLNDTEDPYCLDGSTPAILHRVLRKFVTLQAQALTQRAGRAGYTIEEQQYEEKKNKGLWRALSPMTPERALLLAERLAEAEAASPNWETAILKAGGFTHAEANIKAGRVIPEREWREAARRPA